MSTPVNTVKTPAGYGIHRKRFRSNGPGAGMQSFSLIGSGIFFCSLPFFHSAHRICDTKKENIVLQKINKQIKWDCQIPTAPI
jgi:hypothetical protein